MTHDVPKSCKFRFVKRLFFIFLLFISLFACKKDDTQYDVYFWSDETTSKYKWTLYIEGENKGFLINLPVDPNCSTHDSILSSLIYVQLPAGKYKLEARDNYGTTTSSGTLKIKKNGMSTREKIGGQDVQATDNCLTVKLYDHLKE